MHLESAPDFGFQMVGKLRDLAGRKITRGTIYPTLIRLCQKGLIRSDPARERRQARRYYTLTRRGRSELQKIRLRLK
jgi:DNA-binding PadR family transcriptional regulator